MGYQIQKVKYAYLTIPGRAGQAVKILQALKLAGINLLAFSGFPGKGGKAQIDLVSNNMAGIVKVARKQGWRLSRTKRAFLVQGADKPGAVEKVLKRLADININIIAVDAVAAGKGRYGMIFWVKPDKYGRAASALNAR